ncbi:RNA-binding protein [Acuticoccus sp. M5D2P5]|nr:RNA-binding protein [Acuticoccus kalidii]
MTRRTGAPETMIRFVVAPDGTVVPDIKRRLPGRGVWIDATRESVAMAVKKRAFSRGFKAQVEAPETLADDVAALLRRSALERLSIAHKTGAVVTGFEKVKASLAAGEPAGLVFASDGAMDGRQKLESLAKKACDLHNKGNVIDLFSSAELESTLGRDRVVHVALMPCRSTKIFFLDAERLRAYMFGVTHPEKHREHQPDEHTFAGPLAV